MRHLWVTLITLTFTISGFPGEPAQEGDLGGVPLRDVEPYEPARLPLSAKSARTWIVLRETMVKPLPDQTPLGEVIRSLRGAPGGKGGKAAPLAIYVNPTPLQDSEITMATPIACPFVGRNEVSLHTYLKFILKPFGLSYRVHDGLVVIDSPCDDCPEAVEVSAAEAWTWLLLQEEISLRFPDATPLEEVVKAIHRGAEGKGPGGRGLAIHFNLDGLREAGKERGSPVSIELDRVPLCTSLGLVLEQLGLGFHVRDDGVVIITSFRAAEADLLMDVADAVEGYQTLRYSLFWERQNRKIVTPKPEDQQRPSKDRPHRPQVNEGTSRRQNEPRSRLGIRGPSR
jgi:hypothetical protein